MEVNLLNKSIEENNYEEYIEKILNIFRLSSKESSIIFSLKIKDYKCIMKLSIVRQNGDREEFSDTLFDCNEVFYQRFLDVLVSRFLGSVEVATKDIVNLDDDSLVTFRLITGNNDLFSVDGLSEEHAKYLLGLNEKDDDKYLNASNNNGIGNVWMFILMIIILVITFILITILLG